MEIIKQVTKKLLVGCQGWLARTLGHKRTTPMAVSTRAFFGLVWVALVAACVQGHSEVDLDEVALAGLDNGAVVSPLESKAATRSLLQDESKACVHQLT